jgi:hypothetical protein
MYELKLYDRSRRPPHWTDIIRRDDYAVLAKDVESGATVDREGRPFAAAADVTCLVFESLAAARRHCEAEVERLPTLRLEIYDAEGKRHPPLLVVVHPRQQRTLPAHPWNLRMRARIARLLVAGSLPFLWLDLVHSSGRLIWPTLIGLNMVVVAARLAHLNWSARTAERARLTRWRQAVTRSAAGDAP